jgi:hypothetical protein
VGTRREAAVQDGGKGGAVSLVGWVVGEALGAREGIGGVGEEEEGRRDQESLLSLWV